jgi:hypothetical protein
MISSTRWTGVLSLLAFLALPTVSVAQARACSPFVIGPDTTRYQGITNQLFGGSAGQTFVAADTLISSVSVWRPNGEAYAPMRLWITRTNSTGRPLEDGSGVLYVGPTVAIGSDTASDIPPKRIQFIFNPPFSLPAPGLYAFFIQEPCEFLYNDIYYNQTDDIYPQGRFWRTGRSIYSGCGLSPPGYYSEEINADLIFEVEFCRYATTPTRRTTWGQLKILYR